MPRAMTTAEDSATPPRLMRHDAITLNEALRLPAVRAGIPEVLAGQESLDRPLRWVHAGEFPEMATVLKGGELLLTTGMGIPRGDQAARKWLADLDDSRIAGLVFELGSALSAVPDPIVAEARSRRLPLIVLHHQVAFVEITEAVHREILAHRATLLERGDQTYRRLSELMLDGAGVAAIIDSLADLVDEPVILTRASGGILFQANRGAREADIMSLWEAARRRLKDAPDTLVLPVRLHRDPHWAELTVVSTGRRLDEFDRAALGSAAPLVALALMRDRELHALTARARGEFLSALAEGHLEYSEREAIAKAAALGFDHRAAALLPVVVDRGGASAKLADTDWERLAVHIKRAIQADGRPVLVGMPPTSDGILMVVGLTNAKERVAVAAEVADAIHGCLDRASIPGTELHVSAGRAEPTWRRLRAALRETIAAAAAAAYRRPAPWHDVASPDMTDLLWAFRESPILPRFVQRLAPLAAHDARHGSSLIETLEVYFAHGGRKADAARALHVERQSLYKRLARVEALLGVDLADEDARLALHLALRARDVVHTADAGQRAEHTRG
jgi:PucR family transcriptional regulator, purine catabolism regulatory protein